MNRLLTTLSLMLALLIGSTGVSYAFPYNAEARDLCKKAVDVSCSGALCSKPKWEPKSEYSAIYAKRHEAALKAQRLGIPLLECAKLGGYFYSRKINHYFHKGTAIRYNTDEKSVCKIAIQMNRPIWENKSQRIFVYGEGYVEVLELAKRYKLDEVNCAKLTGWFTDSEIAAYPQPTAGGRSDFNSKERYKASNAKLNNLSRDLGDPKYPQPTAGGKLGFNSPVDNVVVRTKPQPTYTPPTESADARIKRLEAEAKRLKIQKLEQEIARLRGGTATHSASVQQRQAPVRRTPVNTRRHFADDYSCGSNDISCWQNFVLQNPASKRAIKGGSDMTETQFFLTSKILFSSLNSKKLANKRGMLALYDGLLESAKSYEGGRISKKQYLEIGKKLQAEGDKFNEEQEAFRNRTNWKRGFFAFTRALQGHLQRQERNYQEQMKEMNRNQRNEPPRYNCTTGSRVYGSGKNSYLMTNCNPRP